MQLEVMKPWSVKDVPFLQVLFDHGPWWRQPLPAKPCVPEPSPNPARILVGFLVPLCAVTPQCPLHLLGVHPVVELVLQDLRVPCPPLLTHGQDKDL